MEGDMRARRVSAHHPQRVMPDHPCRRDALGVADAIKAPVKGMTWIPGGRSAMGSPTFYPEERPGAQVEVEGFWIDERPVTVARVRAVR